MDENSEMILPFDPPMSHEIVSQWLEAFDNGTFTGDRIEEHWNHWVPMIYSPSLNEDCLNWEFNDQLAKQVLFNPLEMFICRGDPEEALKEIDHANKHPSVCGRFFKNGEPTYSCRECGMDKTCVLCVECFKHSTHRFHKYRMGASSGGGCCDCGDVEAWKKDPFCTVHQVNEEEAQSKSLPEDLIERTRVVFETIMWYAFNRFTSGEGTNLRGASGSGSSTSKSNLYDIDAFCTILYNDEVHTFDQVIQTLGRVLKCPQRTSTEFVTNIDREGRAVVKCASFNVCQEFQQEIEKYTSRHGNKPLKVLVMHAHIIGHQIFAQKLLTWLEKFLGYGKVFRAVFSKCILKQAHKSRPLLAEIMVQDATMWKSVRTQWHRLLIAGMLLEYENKKALAKVFTKNYSQIMKDFIRDDHEHSFSISSISVQLYTVPTLAHHLIAHDDVLFILLNTLISEYRSRVNSYGKLEFERNNSFHVFKRTLFMLFDLKYLVTYVPEYWTDDLKKSFLHGFAVFVKLLVMIQGMDAVTRQVGQHMEFDHEWESGFNLHIKLASCIIYIIQWCATDKVILVKAYRLLLKSLEENPCYDPNEAGEVRELADHSTACLHYDVSARPVSIHLPLSRLLAALHLHLEQYGLHFDSPEFQVAKPTPVQIIEPVLRAQVLVAQVHTGMWRRNGYALLNTLFFYHNVKCRSEMLDRDITLLQIGASLIESNEFVIHVLNKFGLINWALPDFEITSLKSSEEDSMRQTISLVEEFLQLLIVIVGERHMPGVSYVTEKDRVKKDILHALCIKQMPHSELLKCVSDDLGLDEGTIDEVIQDIAKFDQPHKSSNAKGIYKLLPEFYNEFNVFFYHYTREEMSKAEETQRNRRKRQDKIECCPPPPLPKLCESFSLLVNLLQCDVLLHVIQTVFERCLNLRARSFSENQLHRVLHLIGYGLQEEESGHYPFFKFVENASKFKIFETMEQLLTCPRVESHKGLIQWTLKKYRYIANKDIADADIENSNQDSDVSEKERRARMAAEKRAKIMAQMAAQQKNFIKDNAFLYETVTMDVQLTDRSSESNTTASYQMDVTETEPIALGPHQSTRPGLYNTHTCILCQKEERIDIDGPSMVMAAFVQQGNVLNKNVGEYQLSSRSDTLLYLNAALSSGPHTSTCGHVMHSDCWKNFFDNVMVREHRRPYRMRHPSSFNVDKQEFLCPLCECLSNTVLPLVPSLGKVQTELPFIDVSFRDWLECIGYVMSKKKKVCHGIFKCKLEECANLHCTACVNASSGTSIGQSDGSDECDVNCVLQPHQVFYASAATKTDEFLVKNSSPALLELFEEAELDLNPYIMEMVGLFAQATYSKGMNVPPHPLDKRLEAVMWKCLAYTIHSVETVLSYQEKPLLGALISRQRDVVENLVRVVGVSGCSNIRTEFVKSNALNYLTYLLDPNSEEVSILDLDPFAVLVALTYSINSILLPHNAEMRVPTGGVSEWHTLRLVFTFQIVRILLFLKHNEVSSIADEEPPETNDAVTALLQAIDRYSPEVCAARVWEFVKERSKPFLRCCALFYHYLTEVPAPHCLEEQGGDTFENMCAYLDLPASPEALFNDDYIMSLVRLWTSHPNVLSFNESYKNFSIEERHTLPRLINLPEDYSELINSVSSFVCPNTEEECRNPTMCLVCGQTLCSQSYCCQADLEKMPLGACNSHALICGSGVGVFLRIRDCELLLLTAPYRGCFMPAPYLDEHGETDQGLRRGNPLKLNAERYEKLYLMWLNHSLHEEIARQIETSNHIVATQWNLL